MPQDPPSAPELLEAVREWLAEAVLPQAEGGLAFHTRVAMHTLSIVERELTEGSELAEAEHKRLRQLLDADGELDALNRALCVAIRDGSLDARRDEVVKHLRITAAEKLQVANPRYR